jgi:hypothetical protein
MQNPADTINKGFAAGWDMVDKVWEEREKNEIRKAHKSALEDASAKAAQPSKRFVKSEEYSDAMGFSEAFNQHTSMLQSQDESEDEGFNEQAFKNTQEALDSAPGWKPGEDRIKGAAIAAQGLEEQKTRVKLTPEAAALAKQKVAPPAPVVATPITPKPVAKLQDQVKTTPLPPIDILTEAEERRRIEEEEMQRMDDARFAAWQAKQTTKPAIVASKPVDANADAEGIRASTKVVQAINPGGGSVRTNPLTDNLDETITYIERKDKGTLINILEPEGAKAVTIPSGMPVKPRRSVQNIGYYETPKQSAMDIYAKEGVPKIQDKLLAQGKFKEAQAFGEWAKERNNAARGEAYVTALMQAKQGDIHGAVKTMAAIYNRTVPDGQFVRTIPKEGSNELYTVELRDEKTGKLIAPAKEMKVSEIYLSGMANLSPDALFKAEIDQRAAEKKAEADRNKLTVVGNNAINQDGKEVYRGQPTPEKISSVAQLQQEQAALELKLQSLPTTPNYAPQRAKLREQIQQYQDKLTDNPSVIINTHKADPVVEVVTTVNPNGSMTEITKKDGRTIKTVINPPAKDKTVERVNAALAFVDKKNEDVPYDVAASKIQEIAVKHPTMSTANMARYAKQLVIREKYEALRLANPAKAEKFAAPYVLSGDLILSK